MPDRSLKFSRLCLALCTAATVLLCLRWQRIFYLMCADYIISDVPAHVRLALGHNDYSLASVIVRALWSLLGETRGKTALSLVLTANQLFGVGAVLLIVRRMFPALPLWGAWLAALFAHVCGPWIFPGQGEMYLGAFNGNVLHNMTMLFSRSFVPLILLFFFRLWDQRREKLSPRELLLFSLCLLLSTLFKPSFLGAFAPAVFALLVWDFAVTRGRGFQNELFIGLAVIPALAALFWSSRVLYAADFAGTSSGAGLRALTPALFGMLLVKYLRGLLLPLYTGIVRGPKEEARAHLAILWGVLGAAILEAICLAETGYRANDGNFEWGSLTLAPTVFAVSAALLLNLANEKTPASRRKALAGLVLLLGHLAVGLYCLWRPDHAGYDWIWF
ncbi:MAG: hypothetical protein IJT29_02325 [Oscillospiraceae bacterium]|nr:hypothetical protein [Oscillospiraceae bacterium]